MKFTEEKKAQTLAFGAIALWLLSLALPAYFTVLEYSPSWESEHGDTSYGFLCLIAGWLAPGSIRAPENASIPPGFFTLVPPTAAGAFIVGFAWFANILWAWNIIRLLGGRRVHLLAAVPAAVLALASLEPVYIQLGDDQGVNSASVPLVGIYIWALAMCVPLLAAVVMRRPKLPLP